MLYKQTAYIGVDPTSSRKAFIYAAIDQDMKLISLADGELEDVLAVIRDQHIAYVAVNAPSGPNIGLVRDDERRQALPSLRRASRGKDMRLAEHALRSRGIQVATTPGRAESCPPWGQLGFAFYGQLIRLGYRRYPEVEWPHQMLETHPEAAFIALLGQIPFSKATLEGRIQRQLLLHGQGIGIRDPMEFYEEITRYKLLKGILPMETLYEAGELDALMAAFVAFMAGNRPEEVMMVGDADEGQIVLPVKELKAMYAS